MALGPNVVEAWPEVIGCTRRSRARPT